MIHATLTEAELAASYHTVAALRSHPELERFFGWARRQPTDRRIAIRRPNR